MREKSAFGGETTIRFLPEFSGNVSMNKDKRGLETCFVSSASIRGSFFFDH